MALNQNLQRVSHLKRDALLKRKGANMVSSTTRKRKELKVQNPKETAAANCKYGQTVLKSLKKNPKVKHLFLSFRMRRISSRTSVLKTQISSPKVARRA